MTQFTSKLDFKLASKRLNMMARPFSFTRSGSKGTLLLPLLVVITLTFCSKENQPEDAVYPSLELNYEIQTDSVSGEEYMIRLNEKGEPYTGTVVFRYEKDDAIYSSHEYEKGLNIRSAMYDSTGTITHRTENTYNGLLRTTTRQYANDILIEEYQQEDPAAQELGHIKSWHPNGQLKYEVYFSGFEDHKMQFQGLMTLYDESGEIIAQERYRDGELVEVLVARKDS